MTEAKAEKLTAEQLAEQINQLCAANGYRQTVVAVTRSGARVPAQDALLDGFGLSLTLTKVKDNDAIG